MMSFFSKILDKLGIHKKEVSGSASGGVAGTSQPAAAAPPKPVAAAPAPAKPMAAPAKPAAAPAAPVVTAPAPVAAAPKPTPVSEVDVVKHLEQLAATKKGLDWKVSIVDLLKLLEIDNSFEARKELAVELGCPPELMGDSAKMNVWLHKEVLKQIAQNGGNIPKELLD